METEYEICKRYAAQLAAIAALDRSYYLNPCANRTDRSDYAARQNYLQEMRFQFYADLASLQHNGFVPHRHCRSLIRKRLP